MTPRQQQILDFIRSKRIAPTVREIGVEFGIKSPNGVICHLKALERQGLIRRGANKARSIEVVGDDAATSLLRELVAAIDAKQSKLAFSLGTILDIAERAELLLGRGVSN